MRLVLLLWAVISTIGVGQKVEGFIVRDPEPTPTTRKNSNAQLIYAEELLEKYGYLRCVPPGSEGNTNLHILLLRRLKPTSSSQTNQPLDLRLQHFSPLTRLTPRKSTNHLNTKRQWKDAHMHYIWKRRLQDQSVSGLQGQNSFPTNSKYVSVQDPDTGTVHFLAICTKEEIQNAISKFQETYKVGIENGDFDHQTIMLLSKPRCGNPDDEFYDIDNNSNKKYSIHGTKFLQRKRRSLPLPERGKYNKVPIEDDIILENQNSHLNLNEIEDIPNQDYLKSKAIELRGKTREKHPQIELHTEWEPHPKEAARRRRRWIEDLAEKINSGEEDARLASITPHLLAKHGKRTKRSTFSHLGDQFLQTLITWRLVNTGYSSQLEKGVQRASLALAFRMWSEVIPKVFLEDTISDTPIVDINIGFGRGTHLGCVKEFDGLGGELSHALRDFGSAQIHMDDDEHFTMGSEHGTNLLKVAVHEIGHILGLAHVLRNYSIMYAIYEKILPNQGLEIGWEDRKLIQSIYGSCIGAFNTVMDFLRWRPDGSLSYNTYFFRNNHYWMYENRYNRTRFGDPQYINTEWSDLPARIDGYAHVWTADHDLHLFFKGDKYYVYDPTTSKIMPGYPRRIAQDFRGPTTGGRRKSKVIPNNIDTVYFDKRDGNLYFFKGRKVYGYNVSKGYNGCCLPGYPKLIRKEFSAADKDSRTLPRDLDAAYYSYTDQTIFFIKDRFFWELVSFHPNDKNRTNEVIGPFYVHDKWYDICDTKTDPYHAYTLD